VLALLIVGVKVGVTVLVGIRVAVLLTLTLGVTIGMPSFNSMITINIVLCSRS